MSYDAKDFAANPEKYRLFKTAVVARTIFTENAVNDFPEGTHVGVRYLCTAPNQLFRRNEPVYIITRGDKQATVYGNALDRFVL